MYKRYLILAFRHLIKDRTFSIIKLTGLAIGVAACILVALYIQHELSYDGQHLLKDRIVKVNMEYHFGGETGIANVTGNKVATAFSQDFPEIESAVRLIKYPQPIKYQNILLDEPDLYFADSTFFQIFTFPLLNGRIQDQLKQPDQAVLSESAAQRYFGQENPIGKQIRIGSSKEFTVSGVMADPPKNTHIKPSVIASFASLPSPQPESWWNANYVTYLLLHKEANLKALRARIPEYMKSKSGETGSSGDDYLTYQLEKLSDIHLKSTVPGNFEPAGDIRYIYILAVVGLLILLIAGITYVNLTTAASSERSRQIGVQKVLGISKFQLINQNIIESGLVTLTAVMLGLLIANIFLPVFNSLFDRQLDLAVLLQPDALVIILGATIFLSVLAGLYPAFVIVRYHPITALKSQIFSGRNNQWLKNSLIVFQFFISILLTIGALTLHSQMRFIQDKKLGFDKEGVIALRGDRAVLDKYDALKSQMLSIPRVSAVSISYDLPIEIKGGYDVGLDITGQNNRPVTAMPVGLDFLETMDIKLLAGQDFSNTDLKVSDKINSDSNLIQPIIINQSLAKLWGWHEEEAIGKLISFNGNRSIVKGVIGDFHFASLHQPIEPLVIFPEIWGRFILIKLQGQGLNNTLTELGDVWASMISHRPFNYDFLDDQFQEMYRFEAQNIRVTFVFTWLAIFLACLGLFGIASFGFTQRKKEIGIRKVLGSSMVGIFTLLSRKYLFLVIFSVVLASPVAYIIMSQWLNQFAYSINMQWWMFVIAALIAIAIALLTLSFQGIKAALINPIDSLRSE
ncbi:MAG: FtsX-like permease family protein [Saprospiraceae bacterium]|nr:FtsX-like permease family protein [Saprospiraceae bacterium]